MANRDITGSEDLAHAALAGGSESLRGRHEPLERVAPGVFKH